MILNVSRKGRLWKKNKLEEKKMNATWSFLVGFSALLGCNDRNQDSKLDFASDSLEKYSDADFFDIKLKPKPIRADQRLDKRSLDLTQHLFQLRFFRIHYRNDVPLDQPLEGDIIKLQDEGGSVLTADKLADSVIEITTAIERRRLIPDGHYAAVICPISMTKTKDCLIDALPLTTYKKEVQAGRCGKISADNASLNERCKKLLFEGKNTFTAIAYPLTSKNNKFISGDKEMVYLKSSSFQLAGSTAVDPNCVNEVGSMPTNGMANEVLSGVCEGEEPAKTPTPPTPPTPTKTNPPPPSPPQLPQIPPVVQQPRFPPWPPFPMQDPRSFNPRPNFAGFPPGSMPMGAMGNDCFLAGTKILGVRGAEFQQEQSRLTTLEIQTIQAGDWVYNPLTNALYKVTSLNVESLSKGKMIYKIEDSSIQMTGVHPVIRSNGYDIIAALFKDFEQSSQKDTLLYASSGKLIYKSVTVFKEATSEDSRVFNVVTDSSQAIMVSGKTMDLKDLPQKFNCTAKDNKACLHYLAVGDESDLYLVAGDFVKQQELHRNVAYFSSAAYNYSIGK
jgi:hypothetical protein